MVADFRLSIEAKNPYDPESADVVGEVVGPDGKRLSYPAYWGEPVRLEMVEGAERALASGGGKLGTGASRRAPPATGAGGCMRASSTAMPGSRPAGVAHPHRRRRPAPMPCRRCAWSAKDPTSFETADGRWFYPIGINLRSPW